MFVPLRQEANAHSNAYFGAIGLVIIVGVVKPFSKGQPDFLRVENVDWVIPPMRAHAGDRVHLVLLRSCRVYRNRYGRCGDPFGSHWIFQEVDLNVCVRCDR